MPQILSASDANAASPSPAAPPTLALLLAPAPAPSRSPDLLQESPGKGAAVAPSPSANPAANSRASDDDEEEEEEASSDDSAGADQEAAGSEDEQEPKTEADVAEKVASAYRAPSAAAEPPAVPGQPKKVRFLARGANKEIDQSEVDPSSLSGAKGSFVFYGRYCGPGKGFWCFVNSLSLSRESGSD